MLATLAYRGGKAIRNAKSEFGDFRPEGVQNTPLALLSHISDLIEWAHRWTQGAVEYKVAKPGDWESEVARFHRALEEFDAVVASEQALQGRLETLIQAPIADAFTHVGQIALLRRMAGDPVLGEAYRLAPIEPGKLGPEQGPAGREFKVDEGALWKGEK